MEECVIQVLRQLQSCLDESMVALLQSLGQSIYKPLEFTHGLSQQPHLLGVGKNSILLVIAVFCVVALYQQGNQISIFY